MTSFGERTQTFIVRLWLEPREIEGAESELRGWIEHVATGERRYVKAIGEIGPVIETLLEDWSSKGKD